MNLYFRLLWTILAARFRPTAHVLDEVATPFRVWPTDMDVNRHMNLRALAAKPMTGHVPLKTAAE